MDINWSTINLLATHININLKKIVQLECILSLILFLFFRFITVFKIRYRIQINWFFCINTANKKRNPHQIKSNINDTLNDADNWQDTCINSAIDTISSATIASKSKNFNSDGIIAFGIIEHHRVHEAKLHLCQQLFIDFSRCWHLCKLFVKLSRFWS